MRVTIVRGQDKHYTLPSSALDQLEYEDRALLEIFDEFETNVDRLEHGIVGKLFVEHLAVRDAAREVVAEALFHEPALSDLAERLELGLQARRQALDWLDELARGVQPINLNQGQNFDAAARPIGQLLRQEIVVDLEDLIPALRLRLRAADLDSLLPSARLVRHHAPTHPNPKGRRRYERFRSLVRLHALYDWLRGFPTGGTRPHREVDIPVGGTSGTRDRNK